jgi:hypothetical protein
MVKIAGRTLEAAERIIFPIDDESETRESEREVTA